MPLVTKRYSFYFREDKLQVAQLICDIELSNQYPVKDTIHSRAVDLIEQVNIEGNIDIEVTGA